MGAIREREPIPNFILQVLLSLITNFGIIPWVNVTWIIKISNIGGYRYIEAVSQYGQCF